LLKKEHRAINIAEKLTKISEQWSPKIVAQLNHYYFRLVKLQGEFVWHSHADADEIFMMLEG
jgi:mannose-6-phosphate isomerase-like protein (cupin superfamily)